ncbi:pyrroline-5-carboxylate reductase [Neokomagataea thailandica]|uniref:Pyrroline-5-carboxylate reductase n=1 Tax=Neokomagataea tanensis NBRC 106556 TaxID=1223519 RepID=A0ABQ0QH20_9PROT|nr:MULTISPECIES: pyrroline-5-carboxylate reductase [Neokomagataea]GBR44574.1 pyrroline-5-carboxylate reductase [Neokomagataea tanensis NBRC 106556]
MPSTSILLAGCGKLGGALLDGWLASPNPPRMVVLDRHKNCDNENVTIIRSADSVPDDFAPDIIVLAVKPAVADDVITSLTQTLGQRLENAAFLSVMAGRTCASLSAAAQKAGQKCPTLRAMPNTPSTIGAGVSGLYAAPDCTEAQTRLCHDLLSAVGDVVEVSEEKDLLGVTALAGSGPAYVFLLAELLEKAGQAHGLSAETARRLARGTIYGAGRMLNELPDDAETLRKAVTSPNGTTAAALSELMQEEAWPRAVDKAISAAVHRAEELAG